MGENGAIFGFSSIRCFFQETSLGSYSFLDPNYINPQPDQIFLKKKRPSKRNLTKFNVISNPPCIFSNPKSHKINTKTQTLRRKKKKNRTEALARRSDLWIARRRASCCGQLRAGDRTWRIESNGGDRI